MSRVGANALAVGLAALIAAMPAWADVVTDGSVGPAGALPGPDYDIPADLGRLVGENLFHSFDVFDVDTGESATFTEVGATGPIDRVLGRVTGGSGSSIDGTIRSSIDGADLFLLNPAGILFGPNARLDVPAAFHASTADQVVFPGGERFETGAGGAVPVLATTAPEAFGFLGATPGPLAVTGSHLVVGDGETLSLVGGSIIVTGDTAAGEPELAAPAGRIDVVSVATPGRVVLPDGPEAAPRLEDGATGGDVTFLAGRATTSADGAGRIFLRGGRFVFDGDSVVESTTLGDGGLLRPRVDLVGDRVELRASSSLDAITRGAGDAGDIHLTADEIRSDGHRSGIQGFSLGAGAAASVTVNARTYTLGDRSSINLNAGREGAAGTATVRVDELVVEGGSVIAAENWRGSGAGGLVDIEARAVTLDGAGFSVVSRRVGDAGTVRVRADELHARSGRIDARTYRSARGGRVEIESGELGLRDGSSFQAQTEGSGPAGVVTVTAERVLLEGADTGLGAWAANQGGDAGRVSVTADSVEILDGAIAHAASYSAGNAGEVRFEAGTLRVDDAIVSALSSSPSGGDAGSVSIRADRFETAGSGGISVVSFPGAGQAGSVDIEASEMVFGGGGIAAWANPGTTEAAGRIRLAGETIHVIGNEIHAGSFDEGAGGTIEIVAGTLELRDGGSLRVDGTGAGDAGEVRVTAERVSLQDSSILGTASGVGGDAGTVSIEADRFESRGDAGISVVTFGDAGDAGRISLDAREVLLDGRDGEAFTSIAAFTNSGTTGDGGSIAIRAEDLEVRNNARVSVDSSGTGPAGEIIVDVDRLRVVDGGRIRASHRVTGEAGRVVLDARESIRIAGRSPERAAHVDVSSRLGGGGGRVEVRAADLVLEEDGFIATPRSEGEKIGSALIEVERMALRSGGVISSSSFQNNAGSIEIRATESVLISNEGGDPLSLPRLAETSFPGPAGLFAAAAAGPGEGGQLVVDAPRIEIRDGGIVGTSTLGFGSAGDVILRGEQISIRDGGFVDSSSYVVGKAGSVTIEASESLTITGAAPDGTPARVGSATFGAGDGGDVRVSAPEILLDGGALATTTLSPNATGDGGRVEVSGDRITLQNGALIESSSGGPGTAGNVAVEATEALRITGPGTGVFGTTAGAGDGGTIVLAAPDLSIEDGAVVSSEARSDLSGPAIVFRDLVDGGFVEPIVPPTDGATGQAGDVRLEATHLALRDAAIRASTLRGEGGNVVVEALSMVELRRSEISASVHEGSGGNVIIDPVLVVVDDSRVTAQAGAGTGGSIAITTQALLTSPDSVISASAAVGVDGTVAVNAPDTELADALNPLPDSVLDAAGLMHERCAARRSDEANGSFVVAGRDGLSTRRPGGYLPASFRQTGNATPVQRPGAGVLRIADTPAVTRARGGCL